MITTAASNVIQNEEMDFMVLSVSLDLRAKQKVGTHERMNGLLTKALVLLYIYIYI